MKVEANDIVRVESGDTLSAIAAQNEISVEELLAANPQIKNRNVLAAGQRIHIPGKPIAFTLRFVNLVDKPPVGVRYKILLGTKELAAGNVTESHNEAHMKVKEGDRLSIHAQRIGDTALVEVAQLIVKRNHPVMLLRINSAKLPSQTAPHPKTPPQPQPQANKPATPPAAKQTDQGVDHAKGSNPQTQPEHKLLPGDCACGKDMTIDQLAAIFSARKKTDLEKFLVPMNTMMKKYAIDTCLRKSHALAQIGHESGSLRYLAEVLGKGVKEADVYDGYKGRGLIQITYKKNYENYGNYVGKNYLDANKVHLESVDAATDSAGWYWNNGAAEDLNPYADKNDLLLISTAINGAFNGFSDRAAIFKRAHKALLCPSCKVVANQSAEYLAFEKSKVYDNRDVAFAWGHWSDPGSKKSGVVKNAEAAKAGYARFLELNEKKPIKKARFGFKKTEDMIKLAMDSTK
jgi:predicted chitinase/LysM repeat protein